jgi:quinol monooxygenase YgiN
MSRLMIVVEFEVKPEHRNAFVELMKNHARLSRAEGRLPAIRRAAAAER